MNNRSCTCALCATPFDATTSYGLCPACWSKDRLREWDRLRSATYYATRANVRATLTLPEWLTILSDFRGRCAYCLKDYYSLIERVDMRKGLVWGNVVPVCRACKVHKDSSWDTAVDRVASYLHGDLLDLPLDDSQEGEAL